MIRTFRSKALRSFAETGDARKLSIENVGRVRRILTQIETAARPDDLDLPGYRFHELKGRRRGTYALNASANYRITFRWESGDAFDVDLEDYH